MKQVLLVTYVLLQFLSAQSAELTKDYCIVGAGPAGLQLGYFLQQTKRDYIVLEKGDSSGEFFKKYPRHGKVISINKRFTGKTNDEFNMRHDWNSLISDDLSLRVTKYSKEFFPKKTVIVDYFNDYTRVNNISVQYNTSIIDVLTNENEGMPTILTDQNQQRYNCKVLVMATGYSKENIPEFKGSEFTVSYGEVSTNPDDFEGKSVLILGRGNSGFEVADSIFGSTNLVHMIGRSRVKLSWETHYVGDLRAINNGLLDTYQLKSLDGLAEAPVSIMQFYKLPNGKLKFNITGDYDFDNFALRDEYDKVVTCLGFAYDFDVFNVTRAHPKPHPRVKKFPHIKHNYESVDVPNIFFAGTSTHSLDFKKSAGGFIHGFRYTTRALFHLLEWRYQGIPWPGHSLPWTDMLNTILKRINEASGTYQMFSVLGDVILIDDSTRQFRLIEEFPIKLIPRLYEHSGREANRLIVMVFEYGKNFSGAGNDIFRTNRATGEPSEAHNSNFLHPVFYYYSQLPTDDDMVDFVHPDILPKPNRLHHIVEDFLTEFDAEISHILPLRRFLETSIGTDLRSRLMDECFELAITEIVLPDGCRQYLMNQGLYI